MKIINNVAYTNPKEFYELAGGTEHLGDLIGFPSRRVSKAKPRTLNGILDLQRLKDAGITLIVDP